MSLQSLQLDVLYGCRVHELSRDDFSPQRITQAMWHGVVDGYIIFVSLRLPIAFKIWHAVCESPSDSEAASFRVILHVVLW